MKMKTIKKEEASEKLFEIVDLAHRIGAATSIHAWELTMKEWELIAPIPAKEGLSGLITVGAHFLSKWIINIKELTEANGDSSIKTKEVYKHLVIATKTMLETIEKAIKAEKLKTSETMN